MRPRIGVRCEYLVTPISVISQTCGKRIICLTQIRNPSDVEASSAYISLLREKVGNPDLVYTDSEPTLLNFVEKNLHRLSPYAESRQINRCRCGAFEELVGVRMYDLRRVKNRRCTYCEGELYETVEDVLLAKIPWNMAVESCSPQWAFKEYQTFLGRQSAYHKISKEMETARTLIGDKEFGIRYQIVWGFLLAHIAEMEGEDEITLHYVNMVQNKAHIVVAVAKAVNSALRIHLRALPVIWLDPSDLIETCRHSQVKLLSKGLDTKRKELNLSLASWRSIRAHD